MANLQQIMDYKTDLIRLFVNCEEIVNTIDNPNIETPDELINQNIFKDLYIPDVQSATKTYICIGAYVYKVKDDLNLSVELHIWVFTHQDIMNTAFGYTRVDYIQNQIDKLLNGNFHYGIDEIRLVSSKMFRPNAKFGGVELVYIIPDINQSRCNGFDRDKTHN